MESKERKEENKIGGIVLVIVIEERQGKEALIYNACNRMGRT